MKNNENNPIGYTIVNKPAFVNFIYPHCFNSVEAPQDRVLGAMERIVIALYVIKKLSQEILIMTDDKCCGTCKYYCHEDIDNG